MRVRTVRLGDVVELARRAIDVLPPDQYCEIGLRSFGKGIFHKPPVSGVDLGGKRVFAIADGDLVVSNVFAWEGAIGVAGPEEVGRIGSHRFMTWVPRREDVDVKYLFHYLTSDPGLRQLQGASPGSAGRNRTLSIKAFEDLIIPLPQLEEQQAVARKLDGLSRALTRARIDLDVVGRVYDSMERDLIRDRIERGGVPLGHLVEVNPYPSREIPDLIHFVPMADVDGQSGTIVGSRLVSRRELGGGYKQFLPGDHIFARITPCMQNGKTAVFSGSLSKAGYGSTEFHVLRPRGPEPLPELHPLLRSRWLRDQARLRFTGTAGQQRVPADFLETVVVPKIPPGAEASTFAALLDAIDRNRRRVVELVRRRRAIHEALPWALRNRMFADLI